MSSSLSSYQALPAFRCGVLTPALAFLLLAPPFDRILFVARGVSRRSAMPFHFEDPAPFGWKGFRLDSPAPGVRCLVSAFFCSALSTLFNNFGVP